MDNAQIMNEPDPIAERPLVTFALFAYNQEKYIREAVEGAFSQTYEPLEIILSDDCSSDRTFEIMQEMVAAYEGPHEVIIRRGTYNLGTALHVQDVFLRSKGKLFVVASGDDISLEGRVETLVDAWERNGSCAATLHSGRFTFSNEESSKREFIGPSCNVEGEGGYHLFLNSTFSPPAAPTCAYTREIFDFFPPLLGGSIIEDGPIFFRTALIASFISVDQGLILQRSHESNSGVGFRISKTNSWNRYVRSKSISLLNMAMDLKSENLLLNGSDKRKLESRFIGRARRTSALLLPALSKPSFFNIIRFVSCCIFTDGAYVSMRHRISFLRHFFFD